MAMLAALVLPVPVLAAAHPIELDMVVEPVVRPHDPFLRVELAYRAGTDGICRLRVPSRWAGQTDLMKAVRNLELDGADGPLQDSANKPAERTFACRPGAPIRVRYELHQDFEGPVDTQRRHRLLIQPEFFHFNGTAAWILPDFEHTEPELAIDLHWKNLPAGWRLANSFGTDAPRQKIATRSSAFLSGSYVGGDFRIQARGEHGKGVTVAIRGAWQFSDEQYADAVQATIAMERAFWRAPVAPFLVTLIPLAGKGSSGGTGFADAFQTYGTADTEFRGLEGLLAHEYFHNWNPVRLGGLQEPEQLRYWISEGFTDFYAVLLRLRAGHITLDDYVASVNKLLRDAWLSPVRDADNARVLRDFWHGSEVKRLPYQRGNLLALEWNAQIREASGGRRSFDDVMYALESRAARMHEPLTAERFDAVLTQYTGRSALEAIARHIDRGEPVVPRAAWLGQGVVLEQVTFPVFELGVDRGAILENRIAGVVPDSAAYRAGLRDGQKVLRRMGFNLSQPEQTIEFTVADGAERKTIRYQPKAEKGNVVPQFRLPAGLSAEGKAAIMRWLGA